MLEGNTIPVIQYGTLSCALVFSSPSAYKMLVGLSKTSFLGVMV